MGRERTENVATSSSLGVEHGLGGGRELSGVCGAGGDVVGGGGCRDGDGREEGSEDGGGVHFE